MTTVSLSPPPKVILAEDNANLRREAAQRIRLLGYDLSEAGTGSQLITALIAACFGPKSTASRTVVVSDLNPNRMVLDALRMLRSCPACPSLIIVLPVNAVEARSEARQLGAGAILDKPLNVEALMKVLVTQLPPSRTPRVPDRGQPGAPAA